MPRQAPRRVGSTVSIPVNVPDDELDEYIAEMILSDARAKELAYERRGVAAYTQYVCHSRRPSPAARTNKRFLASMIRSVDSHNQRQEASEAQAAQRRVRDRRDTGTRELFQRSVPRELLGRTDRHSRKSTGHPLEDRGEPSRARSLSRWDQPPGEPRPRASRWDQGPQDNYDTRRSRRRSRSPSSEPEIGPQPAPPVRQWDLGKDPAL